MGPAAWSDVGEARQLGEAAGSVAFWAYPGGASDPGEPYRVGGEGSSGYAEARTGRIRVRSDASGCPAAEHFRS